MAKFRIQKEPLQPHFLGVNVDSMGNAAGSLKLCGLKLYLYLMSNSDGFEWNMNPSAYAKWLGIDYEKSGRSVRKAIDDGVKDLIDNGFLKEEKGNYIISEQIVPEWKIGTNCSSQDAKKEQTVPNLYGF